MAGALLADLFRPAHDHPLLFLNNKREREATACTRVIGNERESARGDERDLQHLLVTLVKGNHLTKIIDGDDRMQSALRGFK